MCGIVGYIGKREAYPILIKGLKRLEYRGYDSAGVALLNAKGDLNVYKTKGKVSDLEAYCADKDITGSLGIAHTRWATHGEPSSRNAHPHYSESKNLALIHNGIIENYADLKAKLAEKGVHFLSDTDTEVLVQFVEYVMVRKNLDLLTAIQLVLHEVRARAHGHPDPRQDRAGVCRERPDHPHPHGIRRLRARRGPARERPGLCRGRGARAGRRLAHGLHGRLERQPPPQRRLGQRQRAQPQDDGEQARQGTLLCG